MKKDYERQIAKEVEFWIASILVFSIYISLFLGILYVTVFPGTPQNVIYPIAFFISSIAIAVVSFYLIRVVMKKYIGYVKYSERYNKIMWREETSRKRKIQWHNAIHYAKKVLPLMTEDQSAILLKDAKEFFTEEEVEKIIGKTLTEQKARYLVKRWRELFEEEKEES